MAENEKPTDDVQIEPLSDEELEGVAGGGENQGDSSSGPECCSCSCCSPNNC